MLCTGLRIVLDRHKRCMLSKSHRLSRIDVVARVYLFPVVKKLNVSVPQFSIHPLVPSGRGPAQGIASPEDENDQPITCEDFYLLDPGRRRRYGGIAPRTGDQAPSFV